MRRAAPLALAAAMVALVAALGFVRAAGECTTHPCVYVPLIRAEHEPVGAPVPTQSSLSFCDATPKDLKRWISTLPKANLGEMARQLYQGLGELNQLLTPSENRLQLLIGDEETLQCRRAELESERHGFREEQLVWESQRQHTTLELATQRAELAAAQAALVLRRFSARVKFPIDARVSPRLFTGVVERRPASRSGPARTAS